MSCHVYLRLANVLDILPHLPANYFDACLCDPPYLLEFMGKSFDRQHKSLPGANDGQRMQRWHEGWTREVLRVLKPGAHMLAFGGTRTYHRLASAAEDVGFEVRDMMEWVHGQGYPKGKAQLKPAQEPILVAARQGSHTLNLDACRVAIKESEREVIDNRSGAGFSSGPVMDFGRVGREEGKFKSHANGRWPANLILSHHESCNGECHPDCPVRMLDEQSGISKPRAERVGRKGGNRGALGSFAGSSADAIGRWPEDLGGGASRFFYTAKVSPRERNLGGINCKHPTLKPISLTTYLAKLLLPPLASESHSLSRLLVPFSGAGSEVIGGILAGWNEIIGIEFERESLKDSAYRVSGAVGESEALDWAKISRVPTGYDIRVG